MRLDPAAEAVDGGGGQEAVDRQVGGEGVPLEAVKGEVLAVHEGLPVVQSLPRFGAFGMGQPQRRQSGGGLVVEKAFEQRRRFLPGRGLRGLVVGVAARAAAGLVGIAALVDGMEDAQPLAAAGVDQIDAGQVPPRDPQMQGREVPERGRHLVAPRPPPDTVPSEGRSLRFHRDAEVCLQRSAVGAGPRRVVALDQALERRGAELAVHPAMVVALKPRDGGIVERLQGERLDALEHRHEAAFDRGPQDFLLAVLIRGVGERGRMDDAEPVQPLPDLPGRHRRAVVGHQRPRQAALHEGLAKARARRPRRSPPDTIAGGSPAASGRRGSRAGSASSTRPTRSARGASCGGNRRARGRGCARPRSSAPRAPRAAGLASPSNHLRRRWRTSPSERITRVRVA